MKTILLLIVIFFTANHGLISQTSFEQSSAPKIDGKIADNEWTDAKVFTDFHMMIPKSDSKDYDSTLAYIKQDKEAIYIAIKYWPKGKLIRQSLTRDRSTEEENEFFILLDLENKNQNGYVFVVSFMDNQRDAVIYNQRNQSYEWDWKWENKSKIYKESKNGEAGYVELEIKIPVDRLQNKNTKQFGIDLQLFSYKPDGNYFYYSITPDSELLSLKNLTKFDLSTPFDERLNLRFNLTPFVVAQKFNSIDGKFQYGGEFAVSLDKHKLKNTFHTDESTLEADPFRFSFYGRPIFLQEKRPFFSKDLDIYRTPINLFYTRAIEDINYGFNYTYRSDKLKLGAVYVQEEARDSLSSSPGSRRNFLIARPNFNFPDFNIGGLFIYTHDTLGNYNEKVVSVDGKINLPSRFRFIPQFARSFNTDGTAGNLYNAYLYYEQNSSGGPYMDASYVRYDSNFNATTLFNDFGSNYDEIFAGGGYQFIRNSNTFSNINVFARYYTARRLTDGFRYQNGVYTEVYYKANGWLSMFHNIEYDRPNDYDESGNLVTRNNILTGHNFKILFGSNSFSAGFYGGKYFTTTLKNPYISLDLSPLPGIRLTMNYNYVEQADIKQSIYNIKIDYKIMDKLFLRTYFQKDTYGHRALWNTLLQYEFFGGSSVYFVLNLDGDKLQYTRRYFKVSYEFNF